MSSTTFCISIDAGSTNEIWVDVEYTYQQKFPASFHSPEEPEKIEIDSVKYGNFDMGELLTDVQLEAMGKEILQEMKEESESARIERLVEDRELTPTRIPAIARQFGLFGYY